MGAEVAAVRSGYTSMGLGIVSLLFPCAVVCSFWTRLPLPMPDAVAEWLGGWSLTVAYFGLSMPLGLAAVIVGIMAATRVGNEPRTAADIDQRQAAAIGATCGFVSLVVNAALLLAGLVIWLLSMLCPYPYC